MTDNSSEITKPNKTDVLKRLKEIKPSYPPAVIDGLPTREKVEKSLKTVREGIISAAESAKPHIRQAPQAAERAVEWSRNSRISTEARNRKRNPLQRFFANGLIGWTARTIVQAIPSPVGYGPGDVVTGISALTGKDILSGNDLDLIDRGLYAVATVIPGVPATILITPARFLRRSIEEAVHARTTASPKEAVRHVKEAVSTGREIRNILKDKR